MALGSKLREHVDIKSKTARQAWASLDLHLKHKKNSDLTLQFVEGNKRSELVTIPRDVALLLEKLLECKAKGDQVKIVKARHAPSELSTQDAADLLGVSRPFFIKLLENGEISYRKVGAHRRVNYTDLIDYKKANQAKRQKVLDELTKQAQDLGMGY